MTQIFDNQHEQLSLFDISEDVPIIKKNNDIEKDNNIKSTQIKNKYLSDSLQEIVQNYLNKDIKSAREICDLLIENNKTSDKRFLTGKPMIFADVCRFIEQLVNDGKYAIIEIKKDKSDRLYERVM
jgi:hypothetical protein